MECVCCAQVYSRVLHHAQGGHGLVGACCWSVAHSSYPDYDGFTIYLGQKPAEAVQPHAQAQWREASAASTSQYELGTGLDSARRESTTRASVPSASRSEAYTQPRKRRQSDDETVALIKRHATDMLTLCVTAEAHCRLM